FALLSYSALPRPLTSLFPYTTLFRSSSSPDWQKRGNQPGLFAYGRLKAGVTVDEARADLRMIGERLQHDFATECAETLPVATPLDRKSTRLNSSHGSISYAVFCLKKK